MSYVIKKQDINEENLKIIAKGCQFVEKLLYLCSPKSKRTHL